MTIWPIINLAISKTAIYKNCNVIIWRQLILANFLNSPISPNKSSPIINCFTVHDKASCNLAEQSGYISKVASVNRSLSIIELLCLVEILPDWHVIKFCRFFQIFLE